MTPPEWEPQALRLFEAARRERPGPLVRERTLAAFAELPRERRPRVWRWVSLAAACGSVAAGWLVWSAGSAGEPLSIAPERSTRARPSAPAHSVAPPAPVSSSKQAQPLPAPRQTLPSAQRTINPVPVPPITLEQELVLLDGARAALASGDAAGALVQLDRHRVANGTSLSAEATLLRIQALAGSGKSLEAAVLARAFVNANPNSPLAERARRYVSSTTKSEE
jgi:hypothetical protein